MGVVMEWGEVVLELKEVVVAIALRVWTQSVNFLSSLTQPECTWRTLNTRAIFEVYSEVTRAEK